MLAEHTPPLTYKHKEALLPQAQQELCLCEIVGTAVAIVLTRALEYCVLVALRPENMSKSSAARSLLLLLALQLRSVASFLLPSPAAITRCSRFAPRSAWCGVMRASEADGDTEEASSNVQDGTDGEDEGDDGLARSPAGLSLDGVYKRLTLETQSRADGVVGLESKDTDYAVSLFCVQSCRPATCDHQMPRSVAI